MTLTADIVLQRGDALTVDARVDVADGETIAIVGPNGAGKTSIARAVAGLERIDRGRIALGDQIWDEPATGVFVPAGRRGVGILFQERRLFPHMTAASNVAFALRAAGAPDADVRAAEWLERVGMAGRAADKPARLSGGQAALVALARALAWSPRVLVLDEPFAALDAETKSATRRIVGRHLRDHPGPAIVITHDPLDAFTLGTRIAVVERGRVAQQGTAAEIRERPASRFVAELVGVNWFRGVTVIGGIDIGTVSIAAPHDVPAAADAIAVINPRAVALHAAQPEGSPRNVFPGVVGDVVHTADTVRVRLDGTTTLVAEITPAAAAALQVAPGRPLYATVKATEVSVFRA